MGQKTVSTKAPISTTTAKRHSGKWVALRGSRVAASAGTYRQLQENSRVRDTDVVYRVPVAGRAHFLATRAG